MLKLRTQLFATTALLVLSGAAYAADMPVKAPPPMAPAAPITNWTGFYVGAQIGGASLDPRCSQNFGEFPDESDLIPACNTNDGDLSSTGSLSTASVIGGGKIGFDYQGLFGWDRVVLGVVGEFDWTHLHGSTSSIWPGDSDDVSAASISTDWLASVRGRAGWAFDRVLFYATGGVAWTRLKANAGFTTSDDSFPPSFAGDVSTTKTGAVAGGGFEYRFTPNVSFVGELLWYDFGSTTVNAFCRQCGGGTTYTTTFKSQDIVSGTLGVNWRF